MQVLASNLSCGTPQSGTARHVCKRSKYVKSFCFMGTRAEYKYGSCTRLLPCKVVLPNRALPEILLMSLVKLRLRDSKKRVGAYLQVPGI